MSRWARDRWPFAVGLLLVGGAAAWTWWVYRLPPTQRNDALGFWGFVLALAGLLVPLLLWLGRGHRRADPRPVNALAALLAQAVYGQWRKAADERRLVTPAPIPLRWSLSTLDVAGPVAAAVGAPDAPPAFGPLPGHTTSTEADLTAGGGRRELHHLYAGLASGRIIVVGAPGAGKSATAILLLLDALGHRDQLDDAAQAQCPVPVLFTAHGWDPVTCSVRDWLAARLVTDYPLFGGRNGPAEAAALLAARDKVALVLDGLDEMDEALRPAALQALSDAPFRVVVLTRSPELVQVASQAWLVGAVAIHLHDVAAPDAARYLQRARTGPPPSGWPDLLTHLREHPDGVLARGLSTPLTLTLLRDTYQPGDDVSDLLNPTRYRTTEAVERHLIARVLPAAYTPRAGRAAPRYTLAQAHQTLTFLARRMNQDQTRDLTWWHIPHWAPATPRVLATWLATGLTGGLTGGLVYGLGGALVGLVIMVLLTAVLTQGWWYGVEPRRVRSGLWRAIRSRQVLAKGFPFGLTGGFGGGLLVLFTFGLTDGLAGELAVGLTGGLVGGLVTALAVGLTEDGVDGTSPLDPHEIWRTDLMAGLAVGLAGGLAGGILFGLAGGLADGLTGGLTFGLTIGIPGGFAVGVTTSTTWPTTLAWLQVRISGRVPAVGLMAFLEDAQERGVLRTAGGIYQFRHATLQDQLADQASPSSPAASTVPRPS